ncbi:MAG: FAD-binding oxidoreductase [Oscillatoriaceae bacterium SKW80]|nr:FAD-binding oxidoreductase [Oscillatoriaceae bacterium SKYG93]MCX8120255.1 FAD-binding oxidoreductase [Oscillatoriaceae bacterium SKW80]MDW8453181.1 FAD-dependent oxidoreductase [Oscillatoriaceae cyanobacterium SKYGB_i_bin93]HIK28907.1 FAD-binding oxidoreductase [Oscillatoriaceae cyanobacterium M7585_C2015_266]
MSKVAVIGCGVVGAAIAYELSLVPGLQVTVLEKQAPAAGATSASLGILVGAVSQKVKGRNWQLRKTSLERYETLIPELEALTQRTIPFNRQGILMLCFQAEELPRWQSLAAIRRSQGYELEIWEAEKVKYACPHLNVENVAAGIYSPRDRQLDPTVLTRALVDAAKRQGAIFQFGVSVDKVESTAPDASSQRTCRQIHTTSGTIEVDWLVVAAGLGSLALTSALSQPVDIRPVLGQGLQLRLPHPIGNPDFQPVISGNDVHIAPVGGGDYWVGATVEFPNDSGELVANPALLEAVWQQAIAFCPPLASATVVKTWSGLRPRPERQPAPIIGYLPGFRNVLLATAHYRNGVLLAPATALEIRSCILAGLSDC